MSYIKIARIVYFILALGIITFIFSNSAQVSDVSSEKSRNLLKNALSLIDKLDVVDQTKSIKKHIIEEPIKDEKSIERPISEINFQPDETHETDNPAAGEAVVNKPAEPKEETPKEPEIQENNMTIRIKEDYRIYFGRYTKKEFLATFNKITRKAAHFAEYAILSMALSLMFIAFGKRKRSLYIHCFAAGTVCACFDEMIQLFTDGRAASIYDVLVDFGGLVFGFIIIYHILGKNLIITFNRAAADYLT